MTTPTTAVTFEPEVITAVPAQRRRRGPEPAVRPALTNRAAGRLRAEAAAAAPEDVGFAETRYERTTEDDADVTAYRAAMTRREAAPVRPAEPEPEPDTGAYRGLAAAADTGLAGTGYERTAQDEADVATLVTPQATTGTSPAGAEPAGGPATGGYAGTGPPGAAFAARPIGAVTTPAELVSAARAAAAALAPAHLELGRLSAPLAAIVGAERARAGARQPRQFGGGSRIPPPRPLDPIEIDPVPEATKKIVEAVNARLPDLELPAPEPMPDGTVPTVKRPEGIGTEELATELPADDTPAAVDAMKASEQAKRGAAIAAGNEREAPQELPAVPVDPPVIVDFRRPPAPMPAVAPDPAGKAGVAQALARILADTPAEATKVLKAARNAAFPPNGMADKFMEVTNPFAEDINKALCTEMDKLRNAVGLSTDELTAAITARRADLERIKAGQEARSEAAATAAAGELSDAAARRQAKEEAANQRAQRQLVRRLRAALHSSDHKLVDELAEKRMSVIDDDVGAGVIAINLARDRRLNLIKLYEDAYQEAYRAADDARQAKMPEGEKHAVNENGKVWYDVAVDNLRATMKAKREGTASAHDELLKNLTDAGTSARGAVRAWADKRTNAKLSADKQHDRAAEDAKRQETKISDAAAAAAKADTRSHLLYQVRLVAAVYDQDAKLAAGQMIDESRKLDDATMQMGRRLLAAGDPKDPISAVAAGLRASFTTDRVATLAPQIRDKILAIAPTKDNVADLAAVMFPGGTTGMDMRVDKLWTAFEVWGTHEEEVYEALGGLDAAQGRLLGVRYQDRHNESLEHRIDSEMSGDEFERAMGLYTGDKVRTAKAVISQSEGWFSNDKQLALDAISALPPDQAAKVTADPKVKARLGRVLGDWREQADGRYVPDNRAKLQLDLILELKKITPQVAAAKPGQVPDYVELTPEQRDLQSRIDAIELDRAIRGHGKPDLDAMQKIYDRMRDTLMADPRTAKWPAEEFENELRRRTRAMENAYEREFGPELPKGGVSALRTALADRLVGGEKLDIAVAQLNVDRAGELAGRLQLSTRGLWASDSDVNKAMAANYERAYAEVQRSEACQREVGTVYQRLLKEHVAAGHKPSPEEQAAYRKEANETVATDLAKKWFGDVTKRFGGKYGDQWGGNAATALKDMLIDTTQFNGEKEALARYENGGGLSVAEQVRFGVAGWGMDRDQVVGAISGRTKEQLTRIGADYENTYHENMAERLKEESGGWDESRENGPMERDAFDVREALRGVPTTDEEALEAARRRYTYERDTYFQSNPLEREAAVGGQLWTMREALNRAEQAHKRLETARLSGNPDLIEQVEAGFRSEQLGVLNAADAYRKAVDDYVEGQVKIAAIVAAVVAGIAVEIVSGGTATPAVAAVIASLAGTAASMATRAELLGAAYGKQQIKNDLVVGAVDAIAAALTARLSDMLLGLPKATGATRAELKASLKAIAAQRAAKPLVARAGASAVQHFAQGAPTAIIGALADRRTWQGDAGRAALLAGFTGGATNVVVGGLVHGATTVAGTAMRGLRNVIARDVAATESVVLRSTRDAVAETRTPSGDRLGRLGTPAERLAAQREYLARFPDKTPADFRAALERGTASVEASADRVRELQREMTRELLAGIPARERGLHAGTPIIVLADAEFAARTGSQSRGRAATLVVAGEPVVVIREGAPLSALHEEGIHVRQIRDQANAARVAVLDESRLARWDSTPLEERMAAWKAKLDLEVEAQQQLISDLNGELAKPGLRPEARADLAERLNDARAAHEILSGRRVELEGLDPATQALMKEGKAAPPAYLAEEPRLFAKKSARPPPLPDLSTLEDTASPLVKMGPIQTREGVAYRWVFTLNPEGEVMVGREFVWEDNVGMVAGEARMAGGRLRRQVSVFSPERGEVLETEQVLSRRKNAQGERIWQRSGSASRFGGAAAEMAGRAEMAGKAEAAARMGLAQREVKQVRYNVQDKGGRGLDDVLFRFGRKADGSVMADISIDEIKDYPEDPVPVSKLGAIDTNLPKHIETMRLSLEARLKEGTWAAAGMTEPELRAALQAVTEGRLNVTTRLTPGTKLAGDPLPGLEGRLRQKYGPNITVRMGKPVRVAGIPEGELWFTVHERYRLGGDPSLPGGGVEIFERLAQRPDGYTPESMRTAEAVVFASAKPGLGINGEKVRWAPSGEHLVDDVGPLVVISPQTTTTFDPVRVADQILDTPAQDRPYLPDELAPTPVPKPTRVLIDYGDLSPGQAQALRDALQAQALKRQQQDAAARCLPVFFPHPAAPKSVIR